MKIIYSEYALEQLQKILDFLVYEQGVSIETALVIRDKILDKIDNLLPNPYIAQAEEKLAHLGLSHRRVVVDNYKVVYTIKEDHILIADIFDVHQDPGKMKG